MNFKEHITLNWYFFIPFMLWCVTGGILLLVFDQQQLFYAVNGHYADSADTLMAYTTLLGEGVFIAAILVALLILPRFRNIWYIIAAAVCTILPALITQWIKFSIGAPRPMAVFGNTPWIHHLESWPLLHANGFPSGHTTGAFSLFCFLALLLPDNRKYLGLILFLLAMAVAYSRLYLAAHFFADVYAGSIIGTTIALIVYTFIMKWKQQYLYKKGE